MKISLKGSLLAVFVALAVTGVARAQDADGGGPVAGQPDSAPPPPPPPPPSSDGRRGPPPGPRGGPGAGGPGGMSGPNGTGGNFRSNDGPWGRSGPSPEIVEKMKKAEELDGKVWPLIQKLRAASAKDKPAVKAELRAAIGALFDAKLALQDEERKSHEERAAQLKARIARRKAQREALIDKKLSQAVGEDDDDDWN